jgi:hypothetical protein
MLKIFNAQIIQNLYLGPKYAFSNHMRQHLRYAFINISIIRVCQMSSHYVNGLPPNFRTDVLNRPNMHYMQN